MKLADLDEHDAVIVRRSIAKFLRYAPPGWLAKPKPVDPRLVATSLLTPEPLPPSPKRPKPVRAITERVNWTERIVAHLATVGEPVTTAEITAALGLPVTKLVRVSNALQSMRRRGLVREVGRHAVRGIRPVILWMLKQGVVVCSE